MLIIRFQRLGKKNQPIFRIVLAEKARSVSKKFIEVLGHYNPGTKEFGIKDEERVKYWLGQHVELSPSVENLFVDKGLVKGKKVKAWRPKKKEVKKEEAKEEGKAEIPEPEKAQAADESPDTEKHQQKPAEDKPAEAIAEEAKPEVEKPAEK